MRKPTAKPTANLSTEALQAAIRRRPGIKTDPIDMEFVLQADPGLFRQLLTTQLETHAEIARATANGAAKAAKIVSGGG